MPLSSIAQVLLRLFALSWAVTGFSQLVAHLVGPHINGILLVTPVGLLIISGGVWLLAPRISKALANGNDGSLSLHGVTLRELYAVMFVGLGLYFALDSFANIFNWLHFMSVRNFPEYGFHINQEEPSYYDMAYSIMTFAAGLGLVLSAHIWAEKLSRKVTGRDTAG